MAAAIEATVPLANPSQVSYWVRDLAREAIAMQATLLTQIESAPSAHDPHLAAAPRVEPTPTAYGQQLTPTRVDGAAARAAGARRRNTALAWTGATVLLLALVSAGVWFLRRARANGNLPFVAAAPAMTAGHVEWTVTAVGGKATRTAVEKTLRPLTCVWTTQYRTALRQQGEPVEGTGVLHIQFIPASGKDPLESTAATLSGMNELPFVTHSIPSWATTFARVVPNDGWADAELTFRVRPAACTDSDSNPGVAVSFAKDIRPLMNRPTDAEGQPSGCITCHDPNHPTSPTNLVPLDLTRLAGLRKGGNGSRGKLVIPGKPCESLLVATLRGDNPYAPCRMPWSPPYWSEAEVMLVSDWIAEGARGGDEE